MPRPGPLRQGFVGGQAIGGDVDKGSHGPTGHVERSGIVLRKGVIQVFFPHPNHKLTAENTTGHVAMQHEAEPAEHLLLMDAGPSGEQGPHAIGEVFAVGHLEHHHRAQDLAALHLVECLFYVANADCLGDETIEIQTAL